jgi:hypothetical protein
MSIVDEEEEEDEFVEKTSSMIASEVVSRKRKSSNESQSDDSIASSLRKRARLNSPSHEESVNRMDMTTAAPHSTHAHPSGHKECFLCSWGDKYHDGIMAPHIQKLDLIIDSSYTRCNNEDIAQQAHLYFKENIYDPESGMTMLEKEDVLVHIESLHSLNAKFYIGESIKTWKKMKFLLENSVFKMDPSNAANAIFDYKAFIALEKTQKMLQSLYKTDFQRLLFTEGVSKEDMNKLGAFHQLMPLYTQKDQKRQLEHKKKLNVPSSSNRFMY